MGIQLLEMSEKAGRARENETEGSETRGKAGPIDAQFQKSLMVFSSPLICPLNESFPCSGQRYDVLRYLPNGRVSVLENAFNLL